MFIVLKAFSQSDSLTTEQQYKKILEHNKKSAYANMGLASLCFRNAEYEQSAYYAECCIALHSDYEQEAWLLLGTALEMQKKTQKATDIFQKATMLFPRNHLLWYNLAFVQYKNMEYEKSLQAIDNILYIEKGLQDAYILKSIVLYEKENNPKSALWLMYGIMLNPKNETSKQAFALALKMLNKKHADISLPSFDERTTMLSVLDILNKSNANNIAKEQRTPLDIEQFLIETNLYIEHTIENKNNNLVEDFYIKLKNAGHLIAFEYFILQSSYETIAYEWFKNNPDKLKAFADWLEQN